MSAVTKKMVAEWVEGQHRRGGYRQRSSTMNSLTSCAVNAAFTRVASRGRWTRTGYRVLGAVSENRVARKQSSFFLHALLESLMHTGPEAQV